MSVGVSRILVETRANAVILNLSGMLMKSNLIVTGLKTLEDVDGCLYWESGLEEGCECEWSCVPFQGT